MTPVSSMRRLLDDARRALWIIRSRERLRKLRNDIGVIRDMLADPDLSRTHFPGEPRKSSAQLYADNLLWRIRHGEVNRYYFCWGLDRRAAPRLSELLPERQFNERRDQRNREAMQAAGIDYLQVLRDKERFARFVERHGHPAPRLVAIAGADGLRWSEREKPAPLASLLEAPGGLDVFCKPLRGAFGRGVFNLRVHGGRAFIDGDPIALDRLADRFAEVHVLQERVIQHPALAALHPASLNTLRLITLRDDGDVRLFAGGALRVGAGGRCIDNMSSGGLIVFLDTATGRLTGPGRRVRGGIATHHPDTGVLFDGYSVPHVGDAVDLVRRAHADMPGLHSVGWDVGITPDGPVLIEGNGRWEGGIRLGLDPAFKREFGASNGEP